MQWQKTQRLVGSSEPAWIVENLFLDSLLFLRVLPPGVATLLDLGSGAGLPGIPLKIVKPAIELVLVESRRRRASFLSAAVRELGLQGARVISGRAEDLGAELAGRFDAVVMRCAGDVSQFLPLGARLVRRGGVVVASGPPAPTTLAMGDWVEVEGVRAGSTRRFAVYRLT
ncbi:MAG: 16S rRNA (guanine(527)-N(7))-methyltransferase RsmG [Candidatus Rokubacteria bacterium RIFCSPHIGHO2_12_FULL_73_22]|nr:MAG: 16S rRNA (guanine(527)-N(7))-methyltransferase RsmG [Candidatus Rokubacteria bacterium RIFCSPHIGHO2_12_FULL_73_22]